MRRQHRMIEEMRGRRCLTRMFGYFSVPVHQPHTCMPDSWNTGLPGPRDRTCVVCSEAGHRKGSTAPFTLRTTDSSDGGVASGCGVGTGATAAAPAAAGPTAPAPAVPAPARSWSEVPAANGAAGRGEGPGSGLDVGVPAAAGLGGPCPSSARACAAACAWARPIRVGSVMRVT